MTPNRIAYIFSDTANPFTLTPELPAYTNLERRKAYSLLRHGTGAPLPTIVGDEAIQKLTEKLIADDVPIKRLWIREWPEEDDDYTPLMDIIVTSDFEGDWTGRTIQKIVRATAQSIDAFNGWDVIVIPAQDEVVETEVPNDLYPEHEPNWMSPNWVSPLADLA